MTTRGYGDVGRGRVSRPLRITMAPCAHFYLRAPGFFRHRRTRCLVIFGSDVRARAAERSAGAFLRVATATSPSLFPKHPADRRIRLMSAFLMLSVCSPLPPTPGSDLDCCAHRKPALLLLTLDDCRWQIPRSRRPLHSSRLPTRTCIGEDQIRGSARVTICAAPDSRSVCTFFSRLADY